MQQESIPSEGKRPGDTISTPFCMYLTGWHTICRRKHEEMWWAQDSASSGQGHVRAVDKDIRSQNKHTRHASMQHPDNGITYVLWQRDTISTQFCINPTRYVLSVGKDTSRHNQDTVLHLSNETRTNCGKKHETTSAQHPASMRIWHTFCGQTHEETRWGHAFSSIRPDSVLPVGESVGRHYQHTSLYPSNEITYNLYENTSRQGEHIVLRVKWHYLLPVGEKKRRGHEHAILHRSNEVTYTLWAKTPSAHDSGSIQS